jgi:putative endopeptidase
MVYACVLAIAWTPTHADQVPTTGLNSVAADVAPGDNFFAYANGGWLKVTEIPDGRGKWDSRAEIAQVVRQQISALLDEANAAPAGSDARKVADFRAAWLNRAAIDARGMAPLKPMLARIERIRNKAGLTRFLGSELAADVDPLGMGVYDSSHVLGLAVQEGTHGERNHVAYILQGGLGLNDRESYLSADARAKLALARYRTAIAQVLSQLDRAADGSAADTARRSQAVVELEIALAHSHATPEASADERSADTLWTRADFAREAPGIDWATFFAAAGLSRQHAFVAWHPGAIKGVAARVHAERLQTWKDYLRIRLVARFADVLPTALAGHAVALHGGTAASAGPEPADVRAQRSIDAAQTATQAAMSNAIGKMYVERHFPPEHKARVQTIVRNVVAVVARRVENLAWMSPQARTIALDKLSSLNFDVGYPDRWQDDSKLAIDPVDPVGNLTRIAQHNRNQAIARLGQPVDRREWRVPPQWPGAVLFFHRNAHNFAAALLQPPKFDAAASEAASYGAIGAIVGHEVTHFIDTLGADYMADGVRRRWWSDEDMTRYQTTTEPLARQYSDYRPFPGVALDGKRALTENVADLGGLTAAFDAYRRTLGSKANDREHVRRTDREFFVGFAQAWRAKSRDDALIKQAAGIHAPEMYRVWTVRNLDAWYDAFDVTPGQRMYLPPQQRVRIW